jgi:hypothetical protein
MSCKHEFGCHNCKDTLMMLHVAIKQYLVEPTVNQERLRKELISVKDFIEDIVTGGEAEDRSLE